MEISKLQEDLATIHIHGTIYERVPHLEQIRLILYKEEQNYKS